jgi:DNA-binding CsgD family transcriptional regulator
MAVAPALPSADQARFRDVKIARLLQATGGDVDRVTAVGRYHSTWDRIDVLRVQCEGGPAEYADYPPVALPLRPPAPVPEPVAVTEFRPDPERAEPDPPGRAVTVSPRAAQVGELIAAGKSTQQIANALHITANTAATHVKRLMDATGLRKRRLIREALVAGEIRLVVTRQYQYTKKPGPKPSIAHGEARGYEAHRRLGVPFPEDDGGESCGCRQAHSRQVVDSQRRARERNRLDAAS